MAIYRGSGSSGSADDQASVNEVAENAAAAAESATEAGTSASNAASSATAAAASATSATSSKNAAAASATSAASSATAAASSATTAATQASNASTSATNAAASETAAAASETAAAASETAAAASETAAAASETAAASSASAASTSATNAATSETNAGNSATAAATSATAAQAAQTAAEAAQEAIDGLYLGAQTSDPTLDNNGDPVTAGDWYYNTSTAVTRIYDGSAWQNGAVSTTGFALTANNLSDLADAATARTNLGLGTAATTASTDYATAAQGALADSALQSYTETNDLTSAVTWANVPDANITQTSVTQHQAALSITESQISDFGTYETADADILKADTADTLTAPFRGTITTDNDLSFDMNATNNFKCTPSANGTLTFTNITSGQSGNIFLVNSGGYAISAAATTYISASDLSTISTAGSYFLSYFSDGTNVMVSASAAVTSAGA